LKRNLSRASLLVLLATGMTVCSPLLPFAFGQQYRTIIDKEVGSIYQNPSGFPWSAYGAFDGSPQSLDPDAIRVLLTHFDKFYPAEDNVVRGFPYSALRAYEAQEVTAGRPTIFVTATYMGKSRPVLFSWSLALLNGVPTAPQSNWQYAVNVQDPRFIHFWINHYVQPMIATYQEWQGFGPNLWFQLDECAFEYSLFGVLDDDNKFVAGVPWDSPFPQNQAEYETGIETFFGQVTTLAPDILTMPNIGSMADPSQFPNLFTNVPGAMFEDLYGWHSNSTSYIRNSWYTQTFSYFPWLGSQGRVVNLRALIPSGDPNALLTSFVVYSLLKGPNFFFAPGNEGSTNIDPSQWQGMEAMLGEPTSALQSLQEPGAPGPGYRLFWRNFNGGTAYLNWTGATQSIQLDSQHIYYNPSGNQVSQIQIPDASGTYVATTLNTVLAPRISPRYALPAIGPISVTIESDTPGTTVHYTLDGTTPNSASPTYSGPVQLNNSAVVQAISFEGARSSFPSQASYVISSSTLPDVQFTTSSDSGLQGSYYPVLSLSAIPLVPVTVIYSVQNGTPATGTYTFLPGMTFAILPLTTSSSSTMTVTITGASGATVGPANAFQYNPANGGSGVTVTVSPTNAPLVTGQQQTFTAIVSNASNQNVTWSVDGVTGGNSSAGTISNAGVYVSPSLPGSHIVTVTSVQDPTKSASAAVTVNVVAHNGDFSLTSSPSSATISVGQSAQFTLMVTPVGGFNQVVNFTCANPPNVTCSASPNAVTLDGIHSVAVKLTANSTAGVAGASMLAPLGTKVLFALSAMLLWPLLTVCDGRRRRGSMLTALVLALGLLTSCGGVKSSSGTTSSTGTAGGSYNLTVTGTSGNLRQVTTVVLNVN
jgi:hypothetical protein